MCDWFLPLHMCYSRYIVDAKPKKLKKEAQHTPELVSTVTLKVTYKGKKINIQDASFDV